MLDKEVQKQQQLEELSQESNPVQASSSESSKAQNKASKLLQKLQFGQEQDYLWSRPSKDPKMAQNWDTISDTTNMEAIQPKFGKIS